MKKTQSNATYNKPENPDIMETRYDLQILQSLRKIIRSIDIHSSRLRNEYDITAPQLITLLSIRNERPMTLAQLSHEVQLSPSTMVGIIDRLETKGLVERIRSQIDRRQTHIHITKEGKEFILKAPSPLQEQLATSLKGLSELEQSTISLSLQRVVSLMQAQDIDASPILQTGSIHKKSS
ncbi:MAG: MarR family transcriptional regulator [Deltaproteobacteria bacterium]|nr:MarR family transcriptional regulator [Deltaproteobacteria bacterium]